MRNNVPQHLQPTWVISHNNFSIVHSSNHGRHSPKVIYWHKNVAYTEFQLIKRYQESLHTLVINPTI
jgi:hypothetical protein